ncbi:hypothetical protein IYZ83_002870 [Wolbachia pipientis]|uniref:hypothetical protein n=1 Tax=Wolbachia pipientis TaxID=955 RepID=UPI001F29C449|nr:hypothetical protein [Wolbachia pipientis]UIP92137.1 hypothetical protein IYZ83_002870 [Wolbachia pipientis]
MFVLFFFIPYFHPLFSCFSSGLVLIFSLSKIPFAVSTSPKYFRRLKFLLLAA